MGRPGGWNAWSKPNRDDPGMVRAGAAAAARRRELNVSQRSLAADGVINAGALIAFEKGRSWPRRSHPGQAGGKCCSGRRAPSNGCAAGIGSGDVPPPCQRRTPMEPADEVR